MRGIREIGGSWEDHLPFSNTYRYLPSLKEYSEVSGIPWCEKGFGMCMMNCFIFPKIVKYRHR